jgi:hypothetical protein
MTGKYTVTLVPGDGIGPEITDSVKEIFEGLKVPVEWEQYNVSGETSAGEGLFQEAMDSLRRNKVGLKGEFSLVYICQVVFESNTNRRYPPHPHRPTRPQLLERRHASNPRYLRFRRRLQIPPRFPYPTRKRRFRHYPRKH